jgi:8-oxo-dGTP diphosphatase
MMADVALFVLYDYARDQALMENRPEYINNEGDHWVYPGGKVEDGEMPEAAMLRELHEELSTVKADSYVKLVGPVLGENGWSTYAYLILRWSGTIPEVTDAQHPIKWIKPLEITQVSPGPTATLAVALKLVKVRWS